MKISTRLILLVATALLGIACVVATALYSLDSSLTASRRGQIVNLLTKAEHLVQYYRGLEASGKLSREEAQAEARRALSALNADRKSYFWATTQDGMNLVHPNPDLVGTKTAGNRTTSGLTDTQAYQRGLASDHIALVDVLIRPAQDAPLVAKLQGVVAIPEWKWWIGTGFFYDDINAAYWKLAATLLTISVAIFAVVCAMAWFMTRSVRNALGGEPADAGAFAAQIAAGNLAAEITVAASDRSSLIYALHEMKLKLRELVQGIQQSSESIATGSSEIAQGNTDLSQRTEE